MLRRVALMLVILCLSTAAYARSGGSMGGGSFKSRSSGSSSRGSSSFGGGSRSFSSPSFGGGGGTRFVPVPVPIGGPRYYGSPYSSPGSSSSSGGWIILLVIVGLIIVVVIVARRSKANRADGGTGDGDTRDLMQTGRVQLGIQMQAWSLTERLEAIARSAHTEDPEGLRTMLVQSLAAIRRVVDNVEFGAAEQKAPVAPLEAERQFGRWTGEARLSYDREVVRADKFGVQDQQREVATDGIRDEDGQLAVAEFFVVTLVLATRSFTLPPLRNPADVQNVLTAISGLTASDLAALEIVWSPAAKSDAMSREDMETTFPALRPL